MTMCASGVAKLIEECGELQQILGKKLAYWYTDQHPDGQPISRRIEDEMGDVLAAIYFVADNLGLNAARIEDRREHKEGTFRYWHVIPDNNVDAIDRDLA